MNSDLKTKLFANVIMSSNQPAAFKQPARPRVSVAGVATTGLAILSAAGLAFLVWSKIKPLF
jgi:hypothetical protein